MSTETSPQNHHPRSNVYLPKEEADEINKMAEQTDQSQSSIIAKFYMQGKSNNQEG